MCVCVFLPWFLCSEGWGGVGGVERAAGHLSNLSTSTWRRWRWGGRGLMSGLPSISALTDGGSARLGSSPVPSSPPHTGFFLPSHVTFIFSFFQIPRQF